MKKGFMKVFMMLLTALTLLCLSGCITFVKVTDYIEIDQTTVPEEFKAGSNSLRDIILLVHTIDGGVTRRPLSVSFFNNEEDDSIMYQPGKHTVEICYDRKTTTLELNVVEKYSDVVVQFESNGGQTFDDVQIERTATYSNLPTATKTGFTFGGWYADPSFITPAGEAKANSPVNTLYAKWIAKANIITFEYNYELPENAQSLKKQTVFSGEKITPYETLAREGYHFVGWYQDAALTDEYDFNKLVYSSFTIYARWELKN